MESRRLSHTDLTIPRVCMGTMTFGSQTDLASARQMVNRCWDAGVNFFDTANVYNQGASEEFLGKALGSRRKDAVVASKVSGVMGEGPDYGGLSRAAIRRAIDDSLGRLRTDYLDIYYLHQPDYKTPIEETLAVMDSLRREGKIRYLATSNYSAWQLCEILWLCEKNAWQPPWISQPRYNLLARCIEQEFLPFTARFGVSVVCYNPLAGGLLTGKQNFQRGPAAGTRFDRNPAYLKRFWHPQFFEAVEKLKAIAQKAGTTLVGLALRWLTQQQGVDSIIIGASTPEQLEENLLAAQDFPLDPEVIEACDKVWQALGGPAPKYNR